MPPLRRSKQYINMSKKKIIISILISIFLFLPLVSLTTNSVQAAIINPNDKDKYPEGNYGIDDLVGLAKIAADIILGLVGSITLVMFIYGGVTLLISAGSNEKITKAKNIIIAAVIGLIIVFSGKMIIDLVVNNLQGK